MKNKIKKWHIFLMSFVALMLAVFTSLFNLKADPVDDETGEILLDNWELGIVFYDSTVDAGTTPLTRIDWDASNGTYTSGTPRTITIQINYKNTSAVTTYKPGELEIGLPNLIYSNSSKTDTAYSANWSSSVIVGANDASHSGYDWNFVGGTPSNSQEYYYFTNKNTIEENSNFEGSIQVQYTITPTSKTVAYLDESISNYVKTLKASIGKAGDRIRVTQVLGEVETIITSPNWPENYPNNMNSSENVWEYTNENASSLVIYFDPLSKIEYSYDKLYIYNKAGTQLYYLSGTDMAGKIYHIQGNYVKIVMTSDNTQNYKGFHASISSEIIEQTIIPENLVFSNEITMNYTRTYIHPWTPETYKITKTASKVTSLDGLPAGDYYWVKYGFKLDGSTSPSYPKIGAEFYVVDVFPEECIILDRNLSQLNLENGYWQTSEMVYADRYTSDKTNTLYVGYPKSIYNEENNNLVITNNVDLYLKYRNQEEYHLADNSEVSLNLAEFEFTYSGNLYSIYKYVTRLNSESSQQGYDQNTLYYQALTGEDTKLGAHGRFETRITMTAMYTGKTMDVKFGDDVLYISDLDNSYKKLTDGEYYFSYLTFPSGLKNGNGLTIPNKKYDCELWVRHAGDIDYTLYESFKNQSKTWNFTEEESIAEYYFLIKNVTESIVSFGHVNYVNIINAKDIPQNGIVYNFSFIQVFSNGTLLNEVDLSSYENKTTKELIAEHDLNKYGRYVQRYQDSIGYSYWNLPSPRYEISPTKIMSNFTQNAEEEKFTGTATVYLHGDYLATTLSPHIIKTYNDLIPEDKMLTGFMLYDLLPLGMVLTSTEEEIANRLYLGYRADFYVDGALVSSSSLIKNNLTVEIIENWRNTGRTMIILDIDFSETPALAVVKNIGGSQENLNIFRFSYDYYVPYDAFLESGSVWQNSIYFYYKDRDIDTSTFLTEIKQKDNGTIDPDIIDLNENSQTEDYLAYYTASKSITSIISTHQDVTTFVKTDKNYFAAGTVDASCGADYEYKLRVRTGTADVTNLIVYTNIEEAQPERQRWKGEFLSIDTSYAENKGYVVKPYYSENTSARNLYDENGELNSEWKEFIPAKYTNGLAITFNENCATYHSSDYLYIYYKYENKIYRSNAYYGTSLAGQTIEIPSTDFYIYWYSNYSGNTAYGFSIDNIEPCTTTNIIGSTGYNFPTGTIIELTGTNYPETSHNPYNISETLIWHYTGEQLLITNPTDTTLVKSLAFEYLDTEGKSAIIPANSITFVLIQMHSPADESIKTLARMDCRTQWNALDDYDRPVDFITGINSNVVKVALPNSVDEDSNPSILLRFTKEINGTSPEFENMKLDIADQQTFMIRLTSLTANDDGSYNQIIALLKSNQELIISQIPVGTYLLEELSDNYFDFVDFTNNNDPEIIIEGVTFERTDQGYIITVSEDLTENIEFNIKVTNEIEPNRFYEDKENKENLFLKNKIEENK